MILAAHTFALTLIMLRVCAISMVIILAAIGAMAIIRG